MSYIVIDSEVDSSFFFMVRLFPFLCFTYNLWCQDIFKIEKVAFLYQTLRLISHDMIVPVPGCFPLYLILIHERLLMKFDLCQLVAIDNSPPFKVVFTAL